jgi:hypothetical protein
MLAGASGVPLRTMMVCDAEHFTCPAQAGFGPDGTERRAENFQPGDFAFEFLGVADEPDASGAGCRHQSFAQ